MSAAKKSFTLAQILSVTTGRLCCDIGGVYEILNHATGDNLFTHVLPRVSDFARPLILELYPELRAAGSAESMASLDAHLASHGDPQGAVDHWLESLGLAESYEIPSWSDAWLSMDPVAEMAGMMRKDQQLVVTTGEEGS